MTGRIDSELKQSKPIGNLEAEAYLNVQITARLLRDRLGAVLQAHKLDQSGYNALRILRGAGAAGLSPADVRGRMIDPAVDPSPVLGGLVSRGLAVRRGTVVAITPAGTRLADELDAPVAEGIRALLGSLGDARLRLLISLLEGVRVHVK
jgi:hypothetical protein